jgi:radical SAM protein with 4Fe4S-binding SPASM domain
MCPRQFFKRKDKTALIDVDLVKKIVDQGDLDASYFVELQMNGEPLLHPKLAEIIDIVKSAGVTVGLSTNGTLIQKQIKALLKLDYVTFSLDSFSNYEKIRINRSGHQLSIEEVISDIKFFLIKKKDTVVDIQIVRINDDWKYEEGVFKDEFFGYPVTVRSVPNCYLPYMFPNQIKEPTSKELCLNPWMSVSIACNGNVTPCCISPGDDIILGNLKHQTLREVWAGKEVRKLRQEHQTQNYRSVCSKCYMRSPTLFHLDLFFKSINKRYK